MANLPHELVDEILLWLPVKSVLRFKCVCKYIFAIIGSQSFINSHFKRSSGNRIHLIDLEVHTEDNDTFKKLHAVDYNENFQQELVLEKSYNQSLFGLLFSYCNGLVLLSLFPFSFSLWNPSTRQYKILPACVSVQNSCYRSFGLGYDSTTDDYKAVVITAEEGSNVSQVWIFELRSSHWRRIQDFPYVDYNVIENGGNGDCFVDGALHFLCHDRNEYAPCTIVAFDVAKETFSVVHEPVYPTEVFPICVSVFGGCLSICLWTEEHIDIYVRKKMEGVEFSWTRFYSVTYQSPGDTLQRFLEGRFAYSKEGDKVFLNSNGKLCSYDLNEKILREIVPKNNTNPSHIFSCTESLVSVGL